MDRVASLAQQDDNPYGEQVELWGVRSPSGSEFYVRTEEEGEWYENKRDRYLTDNQFPNVSDLQDLDRLLVLEVMVYRWSFWLGRGFDYDWARVDESSMKNNIKEYSSEIRLLKQALGIDKATRDKDRGESLSDYTEKLLQRAKIFGYHRNKQYETVVTKFWELRSMVATFDRCDEEERALLDLSHESIFEWIRRNVLGPWDEMEAEFRKAQSMWIRDQ